MGFIYKITNDINDKVYIGKTIRTLSIRWSEHLSDYKEIQETNNRPLYSSMLKYGASHFTICEVEECPDELLNEREKFWIAFYDSYENGYNATKGGDGGVGRLHRPKELETKIISRYLEVKSCCQVGKEFGYSRWTIAEILKNNNIDIIPENTAKPVAQYNKDTENLIRIFPSTKAVQKQLGFSDANIGKCCRGQRKTAYGYIWKYLEV